jgi:hypothetical protein
VKSTPIEADTKKKAHWSSSVTLGIGDKGLSIFQKQRGHSVPGECEIHNNTKGVYIREEFIKEGDQQAGGVQITITLKCFYCTPGEEGLHASPI